jgi:hypothetical protein
MIMSAARTHIALKSVIFFSLVTLVHRCCDGEVDESNCAAK